MAEEDTGYFDTGTNHLDVYDDHEPFTSSTLRLNVDVGYKPYWGGREAFRELWQN